MEIRSISDAAASIEDGATVALTGSGGGLLEAEAVFAAIEERFLKTGHPRGLTIVHALGIELHVGPVSEIDFGARDLFGVLVQYPNTDGAIHDYAELAGQTPAIRPRLVSPGF